VFTDVFGGMYCLHFHDQRVSPAIEQASSAWNACITSKKMGHISKVNIRTAAFSNLSRIFILLPCLFDDVIFSFENMNVKSVLI
jgi:hypothetical protein